MQAPGDSRPPLAFEDVVDDHVNASEASETPPGYVNGKWVLVGFLLLFAAASTAIVLISRDMDRKGQKARAMEEKLGRQVGPVDSPKEQKRMERFKKAAE